MIDFVRSLSSWFMSFVRLLDGVTVFSVFTLWDLIFSMVVLCMVACIFWKGAKG